MMPAEDVLEIGHKIVVVQKKIENFQKTASNDFSWGETNSEKLASYEIELYISLELCNTQLKLRESCFMDQLNDFSDDQDYIFTHYIIPFLYFCVFIVIFFIICYQRLIKFSIDEYVSFQQCLKKVMTGYVILMAVFYVLLCVQNTKKDLISIEDVPLLCGKDSETMKFLTDDCFHYSRKCYIFPRKFEYSIAFPFMFVLYGGIAIVCLVFGLKYHIRDD